MAVFFAGKIALCRWGCIPSSCLWTRHCFVHVRATLLPLLHCRVAGCQRRRFVVDIRLQFIASSSYVRLGRRPFAADRRRHVAPTSPDRRRRQRSDADTRARRQRRGSAAGGSRSADVEVGPAVVGRRSRTDTDDRRARQRSGQDVEVERRLERRRRRRQ